MPNNYNINDYILIQLENNNSYKEIFKNNSKIIYINSFDKNINSFDNIKILSFEKNIKNFIKKLLLELKL